MSSQTFRGWVRFGAGTAGRWQAVAEASTRMEAERLASDWAQRQGWRIFDVLGLEAALNPNGRRQQCNRA